MFMYCRNKLCFINKRFFVLPSKNISPRWREITPNAGIIMKNLNSAPLIQKPRMCNNCLTMALAKQEGTGSGFRH